MTFVVPDVYGPAHKWLTTVDPQTVTEAQFRSALVNFLEHGVSTGIPVEQFQHPDSYFLPGDLQLYDSISSVWSVVPKARQCPSLADMLLGMRVHNAGEGRTFRQTIEALYDGFRKWCVAAGKDPDNLNETSEERNRRLSRERMRKKRMRDAESDITDPDEMALVRLIRVAKDNAKAGHAWFKGVESEAKAAHDAAVEAAKLARLHTVSGAREHVIAADRAVSDAEQTLVQYRLNK